MKFHAVSCALPSLPVKVKLPLSFLRFLCLRQGLALLFAPAPPVHHKTTRVHTSLRQVSHQRTPNTQSAVHMIGHTSTPVRDQKGKKEKLAGILFLFVAGVSDFAFELSQAKTIHFNTLGFLSKSKMKQAKQTLDESIYFPLLLTTPPPDIRSI